MNFPTHTQLLSYSLYNTYTIRYIILNRLHKYTLK